MGRLEGEIGSQKSLSTENVALVSKRKEIGRPDIVMFTHGSLLQIIVVVGSKKPGQPHLSVTRPRRSA